MTSVFGINHAELLHHDVDDGLNVPEGTETTEDTMGRSKTSEQQTSI